MKTPSAKSTKPAPQLRRIPALTKRAKASARRTKRRGKKRQWTKRKVRVREAVVSEEGVRRIVREWRRWLWGAYRGMNLSLEDVAAEIGATRQGFSKLLRFADRRFLFDTFVRGCFLRREAETGFAIVVEDWKYQLRWTVERCNGGCLSSTDGRG